MNHPTGLYLHIPFCAGKCPYCDFYSVNADERSIDRYVNALCKSIEHYGTMLNRKADTVYFGGGTPSLIGAKRLSAVKAAAEEFFGFDNAEITVEVNPSKQDFDFELLHKNGFNRISIGLQSANDNELHLLGRQHDIRQADRCITSAQAAGFDNISLDLMIATPQQTKDSLMRSIEFCAEHNVQHISAYLLKVEEGTPYCQIRSSLNLPNDDEQAEMYLFACEKLTEYGFHQYEISNFSKPGFESRHNLKYWHDEEYLGLGPSAHSFVNGKRFYYERSFDAFYSGKTVDDGTGGDTEEWILLGLRLSEGIQNSRFKERFHTDIPKKYFERAKSLEKIGLVTVSNEHISLTEKGLLVSNAVIAQILD